jgi:hypothetical protein
MTMAAAVNLKAHIDSLIATLTTAHIVCAVPQDIVQLRKALKDARENMQIARSQSIHEKVDSKKLQLHVMAATAEEFLHKGAAKLEARIIEEDRKREEFRDTISCAVYGLQDGFQAAIEAMQADNSGLRKLIATLAKDLQPELATATKRVAALEGILRAAAHLKAD